MTRIEAVREVDAWVRGHVDYAADPLLYGLRELWALPEDLADDIERDGKARGDCEDFALLAAARLVMRHGFTGERIWPVLLDTEDRPGRCNHAIICVGIGQTMWTCADTFDLEARPLGQAYRESQLRRWCSILDLTKWRQWG